MVMHIYLVQHGASKSEAEDPERSLTDEGRHVVEQMADHLADVGISVDRVQHSEKLRARQTAEILAASLKPQNGIEQVSGMAPNDDVSAMRISLHSESENVMLVGHLPYLSRLLSSLLLVDENRPVVEFRMGGVVCLIRTENAQFRVVWALTPDLLEAASGLRQAA
jgi:phosphohistidine phosphatase